MTTLSTKARSTVQSTILNNTIETVSEIWCQLHKNSRSLKVSDEGALRLAQVTGAMLSLWSAKRITETKSFKGRGDREGKLRSLLMQSNARHNLCREMCALLSVIESRKEACEKEEDRRATGLLDWAFWRLLNTGIYSQIPNTMRMTEIAPETLERYSATVCSAYYELNNLSVSNATPQAAQALFARATGLPIFEAFNNGTVLTSEDLAQSLTELDVRRERAFFAMVGQALHDLALIRNELVQISKSCKVQSERRKVIAVRRKLESIMCKIVGSGIFFAVPV